MVRLDYRARSLDSVVATFGSPAPARLAWHPDTPEPVRRRPVTIVEPEPLPFWTAVDRLCRAGDLRYIPGSPSGPDNGLQAEYRLFLAPGAGIGPRADSGPFRLELVSSHHVRQVNLVPNSREPGRDFGRSVRPAFGTRAEDFGIELRILAEPRMLIRAVGDALIAEAVDDRGQSLLPGPAPHLHYYGYGFGGQPRAGGSYMLSLKRPEKAGTAIRRLKLTIPVAVQAPAPDRLEIPLAESIGKTVRHGRTAIEVLSVGADPAGHQVVKLRIRTYERDPERLTLDRDGKLVAQPGRKVTPEVTPNVFQVLDQHGRQFPWLPGTVREEDSGTTAELMMWPEGGIAIPVQAGHGIVPGEDRPTAVPAVLFHQETARAVVVSTFEFHDVPLP